MTRDEQRLALVGSALTGLLSQHTFVGDKCNILEACHYTTDQLADAALKSVKVADLTLRAIDARIPNVGDVYAMLTDCWRLLEQMEVAEMFFKPEVTALLDKQKGKRS